MIKNERQYRIAKAKTKDFVLIDLQQARNTCCFFVAEDFEKERIPVRLFASSTTIPTKLFN